MRTPCTLPLDPPLHSKIDKDLHFYLFTHAITVAVNSPFIPLSHRCNLFHRKGQQFSISSLHSKLSIMTHHSSQAAATRLEYDHNGRLISKNPCARDVGTTVSLQNLFSTLPVRHREFLRNIKREFSKLVHVLQGYCLVSTGIRITCSNQGEKGKKTTIVSTNGSKQVKDNITCVFGPKQVCSTHISLVSLPAELPIKLWSYPQFSSYYNFLSSVMYRKRPIHWYCLTIRYGAFK